MKTIKKGEIIKRVKDQDAIDFVKDGWNYIPKNEWKKNRKDETVEIKEKSKSKKKKK